MKLGLFMKILQQDREAILLAEKLGYAEAWVGEHYSAATEPIPDPLQFMATLIPLTTSIKFGTSVLNLPQHHPAQVAGNCAMFDHLSAGRFIMGIGPGGLGSDFELFKVTDKDRSEMMAESIEIIHKIWASDPPYHCPSSEIATAPASFIPPTAGGKGRGSCASPPDGGCTNFARASCSIVGTIIEGGTAR